jgi:hypothetical protein
MKYRKWNLLYKVQDISGRYVSRSSDQQAVEMVEFVKTKKINDLIEKSKEDALWRCLLNGHKYREVSGIEGEICICCGSHPNKPLKLMG